MIETEPQLMSQLAENTQTFKQNFMKNLTDVELIGDKDSPIIHLRLKKGHPQHREKEEMLLQDVVDAAYRDNVCISRSKYCNGQELVLQRPSIRMCITAGLNKKEIERSVTVIREAFKRCIKT